MNINKAGRSYQPGKSLDYDLREVIITKCFGYGGDPLYNFLPVSLSTIAEEAGVAKNTVRKVWSEFCTTRTVNPRARGGDFCSKLSAGDLELIEVLKTTRGSISLRELHAVLDDVGDVTDISLSAISKAIKSKLLSGRKYSRKKITHVARERFTNDNMVYTQLFINYLSAKDPQKIKFFDEAGIKTPDVGTRLYGNSPVGQRCVEIAKKVESPNQTLNLLISLNGPEHYNIINGASNTIEFWNFFEEAAIAGNITTGRPALEVGDIIVMDNLAVHHYEGGEVLEEYLADMGIELIYTPSYSPDLNPVEFCFNKVKGLLNGRLVDNVKNDLKLAVMEAVEDISSSDARKFYLSTSYMFPNV
ncbi:uncharacterized protein LOC116289370 [Actinia tenebrosa]|uniref:Uncharacterized protein LOC116289370 n=1 Tax=Actinia tenebrosa TaxID=6105 RepID=A0A6P8HAF3_ACTTE|nr:uncharacterized protein LOC116289370 [Actinia tenebrosa]